jgi:hypothetical protein
MALTSPLLHFDTFGNVQKVLQAVDKHVPRIFGEDAPQFIDSLKQIIRTHAAQNGWDIVVLSLSKGTARQELESLAALEMSYLGPIIIDPTAHTPEHEVFSKKSLINARKERLIALNESTKDILIVLYGLDNTLPQTLVQLLLKRLQTTESILSGIPEGMTEKFTLKMTRALTRLKSLHKKILEKQQDYVDLDNEDTNGEMFLTLASLQAMMLAADDPQVKATLAALVDQIESVPQDFVGIRASFASFENAAEALIENRNIPTAHMDAHMEAPDIRDMDRNGEVDPGNKYAVQPGGPSLRPR